MSARIVRSLPLALALGAASGCASVTLDVLQPVPVAVSAVTIELRDATRGDMSTEDVASFEDTIASQLESSGIVVRTAAMPDVSPLVGKVSAYDPGNRPLRFLAGYGLGTGSLVSTWEVRDRYGSTTARCRISGDVSLGVFGGSFEDVEEETGNALARFLKGGIQ